MAYKELDFYHLAYPFAQELGFVGAWNLTEDLHMQTTKTTTNSQKPTVLYCGTATARNPQDVDRAFRHHNYDPKITTVDLSSYPLKRLPRNLFPVRASGTNLPFRDGAFDIITTDFLLNMVNLNVVKQIGREWNRVLKPDGVITTTTYTTSSHINTDTSYKRFLYGLGIKNFFGSQALRIALESEGLHVQLEPYSFSKKPYLYPDSPHHLVLRKQSLAETVSMTQNAKDIWKSADTISHITRTNPALAPRQISEVIADIVDESYILDQDKQGGELRAFGRRKKLTSTWSELGPIYVQPHSRGLGFGKDVVRKQLLSSTDMNFLAFSDSPAMIDILARHGFQQEALRTIPPEVVKSLIEDRLRNFPRSIATVRSLFGRSKKLLVRLAK